MASPSAAQVYLSPTMAVLAGIGFASGLPYVLVNDTLSAWLSKIGVEVKTIGFFSLITIPYAFKFLWAPFMDRFAFPGLGALGRRRSWLLVCQLLIAAALGALALFGPSDADSVLWPVSVVGTALVVLSASQDVNADAYRADVLHTRELGAGAAMFVAGYRIAMIVGGGFALILASNFGWRAAYAVMALLMSVCSVVTLLAPRPLNEADTPHSMTEAVIMPLRSLISSRGVAQAILIVLLVLVFRLPDTLAQKMTMPLLIQGLHFDEKEVGYIRQMLGFFITIIGALCGGGLIARFGVMRSLVAFGLLQVLSNAGFLVLAMNEPDRWLMGIVIGIESFCGGLVAAGFVAFLMSCCDHRYSATQYALFTGLIALAASLTGALTGLMVKELGYASFFLWTIIAGVPGMVMLPFLKAMNGQRLEVDGRSFDSNHQPPTTKHSPPSH